MPLPDAISAISISADGICLVSCSPFCPAKTLSNQKEIEKTDILT